MVPQETIQCPHCWKHFTLSEIRWVSVSRQLINDPRLGPESQRRFTPSLFNAECKAIDAYGAECTELACRHCHLGISRPLLGKKLWITSIAGSPASGKSYLLAAMIKSLRDSCHKFSVGFRDADQNANRLILDNEKDLFWNPMHIGVKLLKTQRPMIGDFYDNVEIGGRTQLLAKPFLYSMVLDSRHTHYQYRDEIDRILCLYDNSGESFLPGADAGPTSPVRHLAQSKALFFCYDPTQEPWWRRQIQQHNNEAPLEDVAVIERQEIVLNEMIERIATFRSAAEPDLKRPLIVILTKFDTWGHILGRKKRLAKPWRRDRHSQYTLNTEQIDEVSNQLKELMKQANPSFLYTAEQFTDKLLFVPVSATGVPPDADNNFYPDELRPMWCEVPLLATLAKWGGSMIPFFRSDAPTPIPEVLPPPVIVPPAGGDLPPQRDPSLPQPIAPIAPISQPPPTPEYILRMEDAVQDPNGVDPNLLQVFQKEYHDACIQINDRLTKIKPFLDRSLRPEAIQLASEVEPNLLHWWQLHDLTWIEQWCILIQERWNWPRPPKLKCEIGAHLNTAYGRERDLQDLLKDHRRLPLVGGSLQERFSILLQLQRRDPAAICWEENLEILNPNFNNE